MRATSDLDCRMILGSCFLETGQLSQRWTVVFRSPLNEDFSPRLEIEAAFLYQSDLIIQAKIGCFILNDTISIVSFLIVYDCKESKVGLLLYFTACSWEKYYFLLTLHPAFLFVIIDQCIAKQIFTFFVRTNFSFPILNYPKSQRENIGLMYFFIYAQLSIQCWLMQASVLNM